MENAKDLCKDGIEVKFVKNPRLTQTLLETGHKKLVECTKDYLWGTGIQLNDPQCLTESAGKARAYKALCYKK